MCNTEICISYAGWRSEWLQVYSGIGQWCPFSSLAFIVDVKILAISIRDTDNFSGIALPCDRLDQSFKIG